ncbi:MAG TPA: hypothetical protein VF595_00315 [Tepidisphaeraceae bacterium]|jgi:hypothetical protein
MADGAKVQDIDAIRSFRAAMVKFIESSNAALGDAEAEITRRLSWCEGEQSTFWQGQIRKLTDIISQLKEAIRMKKLFKDSSGRTQSAFDEEKKLRAAQARMEQAEQKLANCRRWAKQLQREHLMYRGGVQRLQTLLSSDLVNSVATLDAVVVQLDAYLSGGAPSLATSEAAPLGQSAGEGVGAGTMNRSADEAPATPPPESEQPAEPSVLQPEKP